MEQREQASTAQEAYAQAAVKDVRQEQAIALVRILIDAAVVHYEVVNGHRRGSEQRACAKETKAAKAVLEAMGYKLDTKTIEQEIYG